jgi:hypothetical protein
MGIPKDLHKAQLQAVDGLRSEIQSLLALPKPPTGDEISDVVEQICSKMVESSSVSPAGVAVTIVTLGLAAWRKHRIESKLRATFHKAILRELRDLIDQTQDYRMDSGSVISHLASVGIHDSTTSEIESIYRAVWDQLQGGMLRDICRKRGIVEVAHYNATIVRDSWMTWKMPVKAATTIPAGG